jgi:hypothetical protein
MTTIKDAIDDLLNNTQLTVADAMDRHFSTAFRQRTNGNWESREEVAIRIAQLRHVFERATTTVLDELRDGTRYAERHVIVLFKRAGGRLTMEVYLFAETDLAPEKRIPC